MTVMPPENPRGFRLRLESLEVEITVSSRFRAVVSLVDPQGRSFQGTAEGSNLPEGRMRASAEATVQALTAFLEGGRPEGGVISLQFRGTRRIRTFDTQVVIVALRAQGVPGRDGGGGGPGEDLDLIGCLAAPEKDLARGAVLAVLDASNRVLTHPGLSAPEGSG
jgi:hypothetical protein